MSNPFYFEQSNLAYVYYFNMKTVQFQVIQLSISTLFISIWHIDSTLSVVNTPDQGGPGSDSNEGVFLIPQSSLSDCLVSYSRPSLVGIPYPSAEVQL